MPPVPSTIVPLRIIRSYSAMFSSSPLAVEGLVDDNKERIADLKQPRTISRGCHRYFPKPQRMSLVLKGIRMIRCRVSLLRLSRGPSAHGLDPWRRPGPISAWAPAFAGVIEWWWQHWSADEINRMYGFELAGKLAVVGDHIIGQIEVDAPAAASRGPELSQSPMSRLVVGVVIRPRSRRTKPA